MSDIIEYRELVQEALRGVVHAVIAEVADTGALPGAHHFYVAFCTDHPETIISNRLRERYPQEMTIVIQHQFWDLTVDDDKFEITLSFDNQPETLTVPFVAIKNFFDPSVRFGLQFSPEEDEEEDEAALESRDLQSPLEDQDAAADEEDNEEDNAEAQKTGEVVSLDQFRKK